MKTATLILVHPKHINESILCFESFIENSINDFSYGAIEYNKDDNVSEIFNSYLDHTPNYQKYEKIKVIIQKDRGYREIKL